MYSYALLANSTNIPSALCIYVKSKQNNFVILIERYPKMGVARYARPACRCDTPWTSPAFLEGGGGARIGQGGAT